MKQLTYLPVLDPVMGDEGRMYVPEALLPAYKSLLPHADLILPNCFEAELLSDTKIEDMQSLVNAIAVLHSRFGIAHIVVTSLRFSPKTRRRMSFSDTDTLAVVGSTRRRGKPDIDVHHECDLT